MHKVLDLKKFAIIPLIFALFLFTLFIVPTAAAEESCITMFYAEGCPHCAKLEAFLHDMEQIHDLNVNYVDANSQPEFFAKLLQEYEVPQDKWGKVPVAFTGDYYCLGDTPCIVNLESKIDEFAGEPCPGEGGENETAPPQTGIHLTIAGITGLALVDAINPCALAVLIILLSTILLRDPSHKKKALKSGLAFSLAVFLCYFVMGMLIVLGLKCVASVTQLSTTGLYKAFGVFAIIIGLLNIKDYFKYGAGGFVMEVPMRWRPKMKEFIKSVTSIKGAFIVGIIVSIFLLPCTAGPYFVAGGLLAGVEWMTALPWLAYYNFLFVLPMIAITLFIYGGLTAVEEVSGWRERNIRRLHLVAGIILVALGVAMVAGLV